MSENKKSISKEVWSACFDGKEAWSFPDFARLMTQFEADCPPECLSTLKVVAHYERGSYDSGDAASMQFVREESTAEYQARLEKERREHEAYEARDRAERERRERAEYERLKAKFKSGA